MEAGSPRSSPQVFIGEVSAARAAARFFAPTSFETGDKRSQCGLPLGARSDAVADHASL